MAVILFKRRLTAYGLIAAVIVAAIIIAIYFTSYHVFIPSATIRIVDPISAVQSRENRTINSRAVVNTNVKNRLTDSLVKYTEGSYSKTRKYVRRPLSASAPTEDAQKEELKEVKYNTEVKYENDLHHGRCYNFPNTKRVTHPLSASEIAQSLARYFEISPRTLKDITEAVDMNLVSINRSDVDNIKVVLGYHGYEHSPHYTWYNFSHCEYTNCIPLNPHRSPTHPMAPDDVTRAASIILFNVVEMYKGSTLPKIPRRPDQYFGVTSLESTGYFYNHLSPAVNGLINFTATYSRKSTVPEWHIFRACMDKREKQLRTKNYFEGKSKGALAYVSNCYSMQYDRLALMEKLKKYIPVDIYGSCRMGDPCREVSNPGSCVKDLHKQYHFYLSFENSLCEDYITEKFWDRLSEASYMLPVAMGGLTVKEYSEQTPKDSFLHLRNFTNIDSLGRYLKGLMTDAKAYNAYHRWREDWDIYKRPIYTRFPSCDLCRIANEQPHMPADPKLSDKYNDPAHCQDY